MPADQRALGSTAVLLGLAWIVIITENAHCSNICGFNGRDFVCCSGWDKDDSGECVVPQCPGGCGENGRCIRPDMCLCADGGYLSYQCDNFGLEEPYNDDPNSLLPNNLAKCPKDCLGRGTCQRGVCVCTEGFEGPACEAETRASCYLALSRGLCVNPIDAMLLTREECCGAFQVAWGNPCHRCTATYCSRGYKFVDRKCTDIDECRLPGICVGGSCRNLIGSFECDCPKDYEYQETSGKCVYKPETCKKQPGVCGEGGDCVDKPDGSFFCRCREGYVLQEKGVKCVPRTLYAFNICQFYKGMVCQNGKCEPNGRSYVCRCDTGFVSSSDRKSCNRAVNMCQTNRDLLCQNGKCISRGSDFYCQCNNGYNPSPDQRRCLSYCDMYPNLCSNGRCVPLVTGSYQCECMSGYVRSGDGRSCQALSNDWGAGSRSPQDWQSQSRNDLANYRSRDTANSNNNNHPNDLKSGFCSVPLYKQKCQGGDCEEIPGSYRCHCLAGFTRSQSGMSCDRYAGDSPMLDKNGMSIKDSMSFCDRFGFDLCLHGQCVESGSSYQCVCDEGFQQAKDGKKCKDIDECTTSAGRCGQGTCVNTLGGYTCQCEAGFAVSEVAGLEFCMDIDECSDNPHVCGNGKCQNLKGSYQCFCYPGYSRGMTGKECVPVAAPSLFVAGVKNCTECNYGCENVDKATLTQVKVVPCSCPGNLFHIESAGVCADTNMVLRVNVDIPTSISKRKRRSSDSEEGIREELSFELSPSADLDKFMNSLREENSHVKKQHCSWLNLFGQNHVYCDYVFV